MKKIAILIIFMTSALIMKAADPAWSVNPGDFSFDMTVTAVLEIDCEELDNPSNRLGAFIGGSVRGSVLTSTIVGGRFLAFLKVYSNSSSEDTVTFMIYNATTDEVVSSVKTTILFQDDAVYGTPSSPFVVRTNNAPTAIVLSSNNAEENQSIGTAVGNFTTTDTDLSDVHTWSLVAGISDDDNTSFNIVGDELQTAELLDFELRSTYSIRVQTDDGSGCTFESSFEIEVSDENDSPSDLALSTLSVEENKVKFDSVAAITATDQDGSETFTYALVAGVGDTDNDFFEVNGSNLIADTLLDFELQDTYTIRLEVRDAAGATYEESFTIMLTDANDAPSGIAISADSISENNTTGQTVGIFSSTDQDIGDAHTYAFKDIPGNNNDQFFIVGSQLRAALSFDFEAANEYFVYVSTFDGQGEEYFTLLTIHIKDENDEPTSIDLSNSSVSESQPIGVFVGVFSSVDQDISQTHSYQFVPGTGDTDNGDFVISNDSLFSNAVFDITIQNQYTIRVESDDLNGGLIGSAFDIFIKDVNNAPTDISINNAFVNENTSLGTTVGTLSATDADLGDGHSFTFVAGIGDDHNASFLIVGTSLRTNASFNFENQVNYNIRVEANDGFGGSTQKTLVIQVVDQNDEPTALLLSNGTVTENSPQGTVVGVLSTTDEDVSDVHGYSFVTSGGGTDHNNFLIVGNEIRTSTEFDFETLTSYFLTILSNDGNGGFIDKQFNISVLDSNDAPTGIALSSTEINEEQPTGTLVGLLTSKDVDVGDFHTYSLVSGTGSTDNNQFVIVNDSLRSNSVFDISVVQSLEIRIRTTDTDGLSIEQAFTITIDDVNDAPTNINLNNSVVSEDATLGSFVGIFTTVDPDAANVHSYSFAAGTGDDNNTAFSIGGNELRTNTLFDFETKSTYTVRIGTNDGLGGTFEKAFVITISNGNDSPTDISLDTNTVAENQSSGTLIGSLSTTDSDVANTHSYTFVTTAGNDYLSFVLSGDQLLTASTFDFETKSNYFITIRTSDGNGGTFDKQFTIAISNGNDAPIGLDLNGTSIDEEQAAGMFIGILSTSDVDPGDTHAYSLVSGTGGGDNADFIVSNDSLFSNVTFDYSDVQELTIRVRTTDSSGLSFEQAFIITVEDVNDPPTDISISASNVNENSTTGDLIGFFSTVDADPGDVHTYELIAGIGGDDNVSFSIIGNELRTNSFFDFETKTSYTIRIKTDDGAGGEFEEVFVIMVTDGNDSPTNISLDSSIVAENQSSGTLIGNLSTTDSDVTNTHSYTFVTTAGNDYLSFILSGDQLLTASTFDFESKSSYFITIRTNDGNGGTFDKQFTIAISNGNDAPIALDLNGTSIDEEQAAGTFIGVLSTSDVDLGDTHAYSLVSGTGGGDNADFIVSNDSLFSNAIFDFSDVQELTIRVRTTDSSGLSFEQAFIITVEDVNDAPTNISISASSVNEKSTIGDLIGSFFTVDADPSDVHTYVLIAGIGGDDNVSFSVVGNELRTNALFDFETKSNYTIRVKTNDSAGGEFEKVFVIMVTDGNDAPTDVAITGTTITENKPIRTLIGLLSSTDIDSSNVHSYSFVTTVGTDYEAFIISGNELLSDVTFDFETKKDYFVSIISNDNLGGTFTKQFIISVLDSNDAPTGLTLSDNEIEEEQPAGTFIGLFTPLDVDFGDTFTYEFVSGPGATHNNQFLIANDSLFSNAVFDLSVIETMSIRVSVTDSNGQSVEAIIDIIVDDINDDPTTVDLTSYSIDENQFIGTVVGILSSEDADEEDEHTFSLVSGAGGDDNGSFEILDGKLLSDVIFDFETKHTFSIRIEANDGSGGVYQDSLEIEVNDVNDSPTDISLVTNLIAENQPIGTTITQLLTADQDTSDDHFYTLEPITGNDNGSFFIFGDELKTNGQFDYELKSNYFVAIRSTDPFGEFVVRQFTVIISDTNDAPTALSLSKNTIREQEPVGTVIGFFSTSDVDFGDAHTYEFVAGPGGEDNGAFTIADNALTNALVFNYQNQQEYAILVKSIDNGGAEVTQAFTISITNLNVGPTEIKLSSTTLKENSPISTLVGTFTSVDEDIDETHTYSLVGGDGSENNDLFTITGDQLLALSTFDFELADPLSIRVSSTDDAGNSFETVFTILITDENEAPVAFDKSFSISELADLGEVIGAVSALDPDNGQTLTYFLLLDEDETSQFSVDVLTGEITFTSGKLNYEKVPEFEIDVIVQDDGLGTLSDTITLTIDVEDEIENALPSVDYISPNDDDINDTWSVTNVENYTDYNLKIYSASGTEVYSIESDYDNTWDGRYDGELLPNGVYYYIFTDNNNSDNMFKGGISLVR